MYRNDILFFYHGGHRGVNVFNVLRLRPVGADVLETLHICGGARQVLHAQSLDGGVPVEQWVVRIVVDDAIEDHQHDIWRNGIGDAVDRAFALAYRIAERESAASLQI